MKTILHLLSSNKLSGAENVVIDIIRNLGNSYKAYYSSPDGPIRQVLKDKQINYIPINSMTPLAVSKIVKQLQPDIIHAHDYRASVIGAVVKGNAKLISHLHNNYTWARSYNSKTLLYFSLMGRMDSIVVVSNSVLQEHVCYKKMLPKTEIIQNCINMEKIYGIQCPKEDRNIDLVFIGRLTDQKDPLTFINCIYKLLKKGIMINSGMVGEGKLREACFNQINQLGLESNVNMYGFQPNPYMFMADSRVLLMPSKWEGFGLVAMEAMSLGVPVVCTGVGGLKDFVVDGENGFVCNNVNEMVGAVESLLSDNELWQRMSESAMKTARMRNNFKSYIHRLQELYG